ncbi:hypothetical protein C5E02_01285 [Rathayibacter rathayi]|nr:hypothetical protein [Rathayibacter rathayi]AZZ48011.1 hypothetical protein C1O28_01375 [Rathayibacter rathayi]PPF50550.1 hypothetical protein C5C08_04835 [Rathayibacter rathayi]PPG45297.1 hypothetical protein C5C20_04500 [Rathayibacter rathayi]PPG80348.1 hypothetical protein C5C15_03275 [Rathayibacter rathayi]PPG87276.1 hypothetical protein C5C47_11150 [Rathayibacter rathayi]
MATVSTENALRAMRATYPDLKGWQARARRLEEPQPGSELAADDAPFSSHRISDTARLSLILSGEHLRLAATAVEAGEWYPSAHFTVLRSALVGAAQAVWLLAPREPAERQERGLMVMGEMYRERQKYVQEASKMQLSEDERREIPLQTEWSRERIARITELRRGRAALSQTDIIRWAVEYRFPDRARQEAIKLLWRQMSADAHVLGWSLFQRVHNFKGDRLSGLAVGAAGGDVEHIAEPFVAAHHLLKEGWSLFDRLCEAP